jgi:beta-glucosidase
MVAAVTRLAVFSRNQVEGSLLPAKGNIIERAARYAYQFFKFLICFPFALTFTTLSFCFSLISSKRKETPLIEFAKHPHWEAETSLPNIKIGTASCAFQENGPEIHPNTNWAAYYRSKNISTSHVPDLWNHPEKAIQKLKELGVDSYRFSIPRDKIEPELGVFDETAVKHYVQFVRALKENNIEPMVTLSHFAEPSYFNWERREDIDGFVAFASKIAEPLYQAGVRKIVTINEPTVVAFQSKIMGEFPPNHKLDFEGAGRILENMIRAHTQVYHALKKVHFDFEIGLAQDPIRFRHYHKFNPLWTPAEKLVCHYLTELNHTAFFKLLQTGKFSLKVPFRTNYTFDLQQVPPLDFIGLQYYTDPLLKFSLSGGKSVTRDKRDKLTSYGYRPYPQGLASALEEFSRLKNPNGQPLPIEITELGIDIGINRDAADVERIRYFDRLFQVIKKALNQGINIRSAYFWAGTGDNFEWPKAFQVRFGLYSFDPETGASAPRPAAHWLQKQIQQRNASRIEMINAP